MPWDGEEYGSQIQIGDPISFWKPCFFTYGKVKARKCMPILLFNHNFFSLMHMELLCIFPS